MATSRTSRALLATAALVLSAATGLANLPQSSASELSGTTTTAGTVGLSQLPLTLGTTTAPYDFSSILNTGKPVRWNPCAAIHWRSNTSRGPAGGLDVLKSAVARVAYLTGTTWTYDGPTTTVPTKSYVPTTKRSTYPPVLIGWTDGVASDLLRYQSKSVLGMTKTAWFGVQKADGSQIAATRAAVIALDRTDALPLRGGTSWTTVALHELGHTMGLAHVSSTTQLLAPVLPRYATDLQAGDKAGLVKLGRTQGCVTLPAGY